MIAIGHEIFYELGIPGDFCVQSVGEAIVFGGWNRVVWHPRSGWRIEEYCCTDEVIAKWNDEIKYIYCPHFKKGG